MNRDKNLPHVCPSCGGRVVVTGVECESCGTQVSGRFTTCPVCRLDDRHRELLMMFLRNRGNLREVQKEMRVSYPTARLRIEEMFEKLESFPARQDPGIVLCRLRKGEITVDEAEQALRNA
ncbi:MAG: DUF2089 domain-containing protein [Candidatus Wallbacteria bacterium]|nr:DUF2089 domain-containing protein [Candidatus Wallbacteria bacterium]